MIEKKNILIIGGAGFIGSHLCEHFINEGYNVVVIDNMITGSESNLPKQAILVKEDITQTNIHGLFTNPIKFEEIWNCACPASPVAYRKHPFETLDTCYIGTKNALNFARNIGAKYIHLSTSEVYGDSSEMSESNKGSVNCFGPRACYDEGKRVAETLCYEYIVKYDMDIRIFRLFNTFGPRMAWNDGRVIPNFIMAAFLGYNIPIYQNSLKTRTFNYVSDTINMMVLASRAKYRHPINISTTENHFTLYELAERIVNIIGSHSIISEIDCEVGDDPTNRYPNTELLQTLIGKYTPVSFDEALTKTIDYFGEMLKTGPKISELLDKNPDLFRTYQTPHFT